MSPPAIDLAALRARTPLLPLIQRHVRLKRVGGQWKGCCPFHAEKTPSFTVYPDHFHCFGCGAHGDAIGFVRQIEGLNLGEAVSRLAAETGLGASRRARPAHAKRSNTSNYAARIVAEMRSLAGSLGERYLRAARGLGDLPLPAEAGFHPAVWSPETRSTHPALVVPCIEYGRVVRVQAILLDPATGAKAAIAAPKLTFGAGYAHVPTTFDARTPNDWVLLNEGPEDAIVVNATTGHRADAILGAGSLGKPRYPAGTKLLIIGDNGETGERQANAAADAHRARGADVRVIFPPRAAKDANDLLRMAGPDAVRAWIMAAILDAQGFAPAAPPFALPTATLVETHAALARIAREAFAPAREGELPPQTLIGGDGGVGKTHAVEMFAPQAQLQAKAEGRPHRIPYLVPEHANLGRQITERYERAGMNVFHLKGRGDPFNPKPTDPCQNPAAVRDAILAGLPPARAACGPGPNGAVCPLFKSCRFQRDQTLAADADVLVMAHNYLFEELPKRVLEGIGRLVIDEDFTAAGDAITTMTVQTFEAGEVAKFPVLHKGNPDNPDAAATRKLTWLLGAVPRVSARVADGYLPADALRAEGLTPDDWAEARRLNWRRKIDVPITPGMDPHKREELVRGAAINRQLGSIAAILLGLVAVQRDGERGAGRITLSTCRTRKGSSREITALGQKQLARWTLDLPVIMMGATTRIEDAQRFFPRAKLLAPPRPAAPHAFHRLILGSFGKSTLERNPRRVEDIALWLAVMYPGANHGAVTFKSAAAHLKQLPGVQIVTHGANAGDDELRDVDVHSVIGGLSPKPAAIAELAAARSGRAVPVAGALSSTDTVLMRDGSGVAVRVRAYADPDAQAVHRAIFNGSIDQGGARARPALRTAANPADINTFANAAPSTPVDEILLWANNKPDRLFRMMHAGRVYWNASRMHQVYPDLFDTRRAAIDARGRMGDVRERVRTLAARDPLPWCEVAYQIPGQGHGVEIGWCREHDAEAYLDDLADRNGALVYRRVLPFTRGREVVRSPLYGYYRPMRTTSRPARVWTAPDVIAKPAPAHSDVWGAPDG